MTTLSAEEIGNNIYLLTEILLRLPIKPLMRLKCVSKQWLSLISDPQFCLSHNRHHHSPYPTPTALLLTKSYTTIHEFNIIIPLQHDTLCKFPPMAYLNNPHIKILQSSNGLLLCRSWYYVKPPNELCQPQLPSSRIDRYFICNSITKQFNNLPFPNPEFLDSALNLSLAFDPLKSIHYKIIAFLPVKSHDQKQVNSHKQCQIYIYSSETDSWIPTEIIFTAPLRMGLHTVFCNGAIHWSSCDENLLYFDFDSECLSTMPMLTSSDDIQYLGESRGHLHLIVKDIDSDFTLEFDVLEMAKDHSGWFVRYHVNLDAMRIVFPKLFWHGEEEYKNDFCVLFVIRAEKEEESMVVVTLNDRAISYNISDGTSEELFDLESKSEVGLSVFVYKEYHGYQCFETLSCV